MLPRSLLAGAALVAGSVAQFAQYSSSGCSLAVNIPANTASSGSGSIFFQISAPSGTQWVSFGQGSRMAGSQMFVVYAASSSNVTVSPRLGTGHSEPNFNSAASISVLEGSGIGSDGSLVANVRCDSCMSWSGGSMSPTSSSSSWIFAYRGGDALDSADQSANIQQHGNTNTFSLDLTTGTGGSSSNPFVAAASDSSSSAAPSGTDSAAPSVSTDPSQTTTSHAGTTETTTKATATGGVSVPIASSNPSSSGTSSESKGPDNGTRIGHATVMSLVFVVLFPLSALTLYLPYNNKVRHVHAPLQILTIILMLVGLGLGVKLGNSLDYLDGYHMVIGFLIVAWMVLFQPMLGLLQHLHFRKTGTRSLFGHTHRSIGRIVMALGIINGGLGFMITGPVGSYYVPRYAVVVYSIFAVIIFLIYLAVVFWPKSNRSGEFSPGEKSRPRTDGYEMHGRILPGHGRPNGRRI